MERGLSGTRGLVLAVVVALGSVAHACMCAIPTLTERYHGADAAALAVVVDAWPGLKEDEPGLGLFEIVEIGRDPKGLLQVGQAVFAPIYSDAFAANHVVLTADLDDDGTIYYSMCATGREAFAYVRAAPTENRPAAERMQYFLRQLANPDEIVSSDAFRECNSYSLPEWRQIRHDLSRDQLLSWLKAKPDEPFVRGLYFQLLALCGDPADAELMKAEILAKPGDENTVSAETVVAYLMLTGEPGLDLLETERLKNPAVTEDDRAVVLSALELLHWDESPSIPAERLENVFRSELEDPKRACGAVSTLSGWRDWKSAARIRGLYVSGKDVTEDQSDLNNAVISYFQSFRDEEGGQHIDAARTYLKELRRIDPARMAEFDEADRPEPPLF